MAIQRDQLMAMALMTSIVALVGMAVLSAFKPPNDWTTFSKASDALVSIITGILVGHFSSRRP